MKLKLIFTCTAVSLLGLSGCKPNKDNTAANEPVPEVRGKAIAKLNAPEKPGPTPATNSASTEATATVATNSPPPALAQTQESTNKNTAVDIVLPEVDPDKVAKVPVPIPPKPETTNPPPLKVVETKGSPAPQKAATTESPAPQTGGETTTAAKTEPVKMIDGEYAEVTFDKLAGFDYEVPDEEYDPDKKPDPAKQPDQIPGAIKAFNKKRVALKGFMLPLKVEDGHITEMLIMRDQSMCCYGTVPKINEWVSVKMTGKGVKPIMDQAVTVYGRLRVGEIRENGYLVGIYEMDGEKLMGPLEF